MKDSVLSSFCNKDYLSAEIEDAAVSWIARRDAGLSEAESVEINAWLAADSRHAAVFSELETVWANFNRPRCEGRGELLFQDISSRAMLAKRRHRRVFVYATTALAAAAALVFDFVPSKPQPISTAPSIAVHPDRQLLPDGSSVELNAGAQIAIEFTPDKRAVRLLRGEALFDVVKDPVRPFVVSAAQIEVRAVGTAFTVRHGREEIAILVTEGQVAVEHVDAGPPAASPENVPAPIYLVAGRRVSIPVDTAFSVPEKKEISPKEIAEALAWRSRRVEFTRTPLSEAVDLFNRQPGKRLVLGDDAIGALRITGVFWTDNPEGFSRLLVSCLGLNADTDAQGRIVLRE